MDRVTNPDFTMIRVHPTHMEMMQVHVDSSAPEEACGIIGGRAGQANIVIPIENMYHSPVRYRMEPQAQWNALQYLEREGLELMGIYHSHPSGPEEPSLSDVKQAYYPEAFYLIWFKKEGIWQCSAFRIVNRRTSHISIIVEEETK